MKVIMTKDVKGVGQRDTMKEVSDGYALNFLIAQGLAVQATPEKIAALNAKIQKESASQAEREKEWQAHAKRLEQVTLSVHAKANDNGQLYEQLSPGLIVESVRKELGIDIPPDAIVLNAPIKAVGETTVGVRLGTSVAKFKVNVIKAVK